MKQVSPRYDKVSGEQECVVNRRGDNAVILSVSRRTDVPAYYAEWFMHRLRAGYLMTRNPMNKNQIRRVKLHPDVIDCIVFWTKDPAPLLPMLNELDFLGYRYFFQFTITPYDQTMEKYIRHIDDVVQTFRELSMRLGKDRLLWRYDPIILTEELDYKYHGKSFEKLCTQLADYCSGVTISFLTLYRRLLSNKSLQSASEAEKLIVAEVISAIAEKYALPVYACCEQMNLSSYNIIPAACIDAQRIQQLFGRMIAAGHDVNQRNGCGCTASVDVGVYNTCPGGCIYCYANYSHDSIMANLRRHNVNGEFLLGNCSGAVHLDSYQHAEAGCWA